MEFKLDDHGFSWIAKAIFPSWAGYLDRSGMYGGSGRHERSDGSVEIVFAPEGRDNRALDAGELSLVQWLMDNEPAVSASVKEAVFSRYSALQESYGYDEAEKAEIMPDIHHADELKNLIGLYTVNVHQVERDGIPYLGFEFGCSWDEEHGLGVLMHGTRPVEVGGADTALLLWMAERDAQEG